MGKSLAIPRVIPEDWKRLDLIVNKIKMRLGSTSSPTHVGMTLTGLTASSLVGTDASKALESVTIGTGLAYARPTISFSHLGIEALTDPGADKIMFWDDSATVCKWLGAGSSLAITTTTLNTIQDIRTSASPQFAGLTITGNIVFTTDNSHIGFANPRLVFSDTNDRIEITGSLVVSTSLFLQEQNAALASIPTRGQIWTKIGDPNTLWFTDDTNVDFNIAPQHLLTTSSPTFVKVNCTDEDNILQVDGTTILRTGTAANFNLFIGEGTFNNDDGQYNVGIGYQAGYLNDTTGVGVEGDYNVYIGHTAGGATVGGNNTGYYNVAIGYQSLMKNTTGYMNFALGRSALQDNTTGARHVGVGYGALERNTTGFANMGLGYYAMRFNQTGNYNVAVGYQAGHGVVGNSYSENVLIGREAGYGLTTGSSNIFIGFKAGYRQTNLGNRLIIDNQIRTTAANEAIQSLIYGIFNATPESQSLRFNVGNLTLASGTPYQYLINNTHEDTDGGGESRIIGKREDGAGTETTVGQIEISHDGVVANDQLGKMIFSVNTGAGLVQALEVGSDLLATFGGAVNITTIAAEGADVDKFLVDSTGVIKYRTGVQVLSDIGGQTHGDVLDDFNTLGAVTGDDYVLIGTGAGVLAWETGATLRTSIGVDAAGTGAGLVAAHEGTYNHANYNTAYGWGGHAGLYSDVAHLHNGDTLQCDGINSDGGAFAFNTTATVTFNSNVSVGDGELTCGSINRVTGNLTLELGGVATISLGTTLTRLYQPTYLDSGSLVVGKDDDVAGVVTCYGGATGSYGGRIYFYTNGDADDTINSYYIRVQNDDLHFGDSLNGNILSFTGTTGAIGIHTPVTMDAVCDLTIAGHIVFNTNNSYIGFANPRITFNDTDNQIEVTGNIVGSNSLYLAEKADQDTDIANHGQVWIKTGAPNTLWFTDDAGTDFRIGGGAEVLNVNTITASTDAADVSACNILLVDATAGDIVLGGFSGGVDHQIVYVFKYITTNRLTIEHDEATGTQKLRNDAGGDIAFSDGIYGNISYICKGDVWYQLAYLSTP